MHADYKELERQSTTNEKKCLESEAADRQKQNDVVMQLIQTVIGNRNSV